MPSWLHYIIYNLLFSSNLHKILIILLSDLIYLFKLLSRFFLLYHSREQIFQIIYLILILIIEYLEIDNRILYNWILYDNRILKLIIG